MCKLRGFDRRQTRYALTSERVNISE
jgi:hypothetical protein